MNPMCSRCNLVVYPVEKLNCLDKYWHKACFSCEVCQMTLNMKTYKGYNKRPYCSAHYPSTKFTVVADTPENLRLKAQSENQSQVRYKEDFEKNKGKGFSVVTDTPELERLKKTQNQISNVKYHEGFEKTKFAGPATPDNQPGSAPAPNFYRPAEPARVAEAAPAPATPSFGKQYRAIYDYSAADDDEVSFMDGDVIVDVQQIDDGWMHGRVQRTGQGEELSRAMTLSYRRSPGGCEERPSEEEKNHEDNKLKPNSLPLTPLFALCHFIFALVFQSSKALNVYF